jgi:hypothetical protein
MSQCFLAIKASTEREVASLPFDAVQAGICSWWNLPCLLLVGHACHALEWYHKPPIAATWSRDSWAVSVTLLSALDRGGVLSTRDVVSNSCICFFPHFSLSTNASVNYHLELCLFSPRPCKNARSLGWVVFDTLLPGYATLSFLLSFHAYGCLLF